MKSDFVLVHKSDAFSTVFSFVIGWNWIMSVMLFEYSPHSHAKDIIAKQLK